MGVELQQGLGPRDQKSVFHMGRYFDHSGRRNLVALIPHRHDALPLMDIAEFLLLMVVDLEAFAWLCFKQGERNIISGCQQFDDDTGFFFPLP